MIQTNFSKPWLAIHFSMGVPEHSASAHATEKEAIDAAREMFMDTYNQNSEVYVFELKRIVKLEAAEQYP